LADTTSHWLSSTILGRQLVGTGRSALRCIVQKKGEKHMLQIYVSSVLDVS
jgi:hypothetical protein